MQDISFPMILYLELHGVRWTLCICLVPRNAHNPNQTPSVNSPKKSTNFLIFILVIIGLL